MAVVGFIASVVFFETHPGAEDSWLFSLLFTVVFVTGVIAPGMYIGARRDLLATLQERAERAEREQELRVDQAQVMERARIAREMHDVLAHRLSLVALQAGALEYCRGLTDAEVAEAAAVTRQERPSGPGGPARDPRGPAHRRPDGSHRNRPSRPSSTCRHWSRRPRVPGRGCASTTGSRTWRQAPEAVGRSVYRMVQESLTNARKHAPDTTVDVTLSGGPGGGLGLEVRNPIRVGPPRARHPARGWA